MTKQESEKDDEARNAGETEGLTKEAIRLAVLVAEEKKRAVWWPRRGYRAKLIKKLSGQSEPKIIEDVFSPEEWLELERLAQLHKNGTPEEQEAADKELATFGMKYGLVSALRDALIRSKEK